MPQAAGWARGQMENRPLGAPGGADRPLVEQSGVLQGGVCKVFCGLAGTVSDGLETEFLPGGCSLKGRGWVVSREHSLCEGKLRDKRGRRSVQPCHQQPERALSLVGAHPSPALAGEPERKACPVSSVSEEQTGPWD